MKIAFDIGRVIVKYQAIFDPRLNAHSGGTRRGQTLPQENDGGEAVGISTHRQDNTSHLRCDKL
jgi:hypothetical protein